MEGEPEYLHQLFQEKEEGGSYLAFGCELYDSMQIKQLYNRINKLGFIDRSIILMWLENMSYEEIGAILGITANNVSVKLVRIREKLKQM